MRGLRGSVMFVLCVATPACGSSAKNTGGTGGSGGGGGGAGTNVDAAVNGISCDPFAACGGNIVGTWRLVSSCGSVSSWPCPSSDRIAVKSSVTQEAYTFASNGTFSVAASGDLTETLVYPPACLGGITDAGISQACADIESAFLTRTGDAGTQMVVVKSASCSAAANDACVCNAVLTTTGSQIATSGSYTTSGNQVTLIASASDGGVRDAGTDAAWEYCVSGNTLTLHTVSSSADGVMTLTR
jgi:hypothetical protein